MARRKISDIKAANEAAREALLSGSKPGIAKVGNPDYIGDLTWWDPAFGWRGDVAAVAEAFRNEGFVPEQVLPPSPDWIVAFGRAVAHVRAGCAKKDVDLKDAAKGPNGERRVAILNITRGGEVTTADAGTVVCPKDGSKPYVERTDPSGIAAEIVATAETYFGRYISDDVRTTVVQTYERANALAGRNTVPYIIYWCPPSDILRRLEKACKACGWGRISIFAGYGSDELSKEACVTAANDGLEAKLRAFSEECSKYAGADPTATRAATIESKIADIKTLRAQWALYRSILGAQVETGDERIAALEDSLRATLGLVEAAHAAA